MTTATAETLVIPRAILFDLLATISAAGSLVQLDDDRQPDREHLADAIFGTESRFREELLGELGDELDELDARSNEIEASVIEQAWELHTANEVATAEYERKWGRVAKLRVLAERIREVGGDDARYPTSDELREARDAR
jgi:hypothetical protein